MAQKRKPKPRPAKAKRKADEPLAMGRLDTVCMDVSDLAPAPYNPRKIDKSSIVALQASMEKFALVEPLVWNKRSRTVVGGHQRLKVLVELGAVETDVVVVDLDKADERALNLALNSPRLQGDFDKDKLGAMLEDLAKDMPELDFKALRLDELFQHGLGAQTAKDLDDAVPSKPEEAQKKWKVRRGDLWEVPSLSVPGSTHRMVCGDVREDVDVVKALGGQRYNLLVTDPPYGVDYGAKNEFLNVIGPPNRIEKPIDNDGAKPSNMSEFWIAAFTSVRKHALNGAAYYSTGPFGVLLVPFLLAFEKAGFPLQQQLIWAKNGPVLGRSDYNYKHELILYGWVKGAHKFYGEPGECSVWEIDRPRKSALHPTMKPVELFARMISNSSRKGELVFDPFFGSGTTFVACETLGRLCAGIDISEEYVAVTLQRLQDMGLSPKKATKKKGASRAKKSKGKKKAAQTKA